MVTLKRAGGNWVMGERFFNRDHELRAFIEHLDEGSNILLVAPRRTGKTSLMREAGRRIADRYDCLHVNLEDCRTPADAVVALSLATREYRGLWDRTVEVFRNVLGRVEELGVDELTIKLQDGAAGDWRPKGDRLFAALAAADRPVVVFLDEVPLLVNRLLRDENGDARPGGREAADVFVSWLRAVAQRHQGRLRMVVTGSIGLEPVLRQVGLSAALNHLVPFDLEPWSAATAIACLNALAANYRLRFERGAAEAMVERLGCCVPHHVQMFFSHVYDDAKRRGSSNCSPADVERTYRERMLGVRGHAELSHLEERLSLVLGRSRLPMALDLLTEAAVVGSLTPEAARRLAADHLAEDARATGLREIIEILEHDGYLRRDPHGYSFVSRLVRDWWRARFQFGYVPANDRG